MHENKKHPTNQIKNQNLKTTASKKRGKKKKQREKNPTNSIDISMHSLILVCARQRSPSELPP